MAAIQTRSRPAVVSLQTAHTPFSDSRHLLCPFDGSLALASDSICYVVSILGSI